MEVLKSESNTRKKTALCHRHPSYVSSYISVTDKHTHKIMIVYKESMIIDKTKQQNLYIYSMYTGQLGLGFLTAYLSPKSKTCQQRTMCFLF